MIAPQDHQSICRLLNVEEAPADVAAEYAICKSMYDRDGHSGPIGTVAIIDMLRRLGRRSPEAKKPDPKTDWESLPIDGTVRVEARYFGDWQPGTFLGFGDYKVLMIRLDDSPIIRECRKDMVRFMEIVEKPVPMDEAPDARAALVTVGGEAEEEVSFGESQPLVSEPVDLSSAKPGADLWVEYKADIVEATLIERRPSGKLLVDIDGSPVEVEEGAVHNLGAIA